MLKERTNSETELKKQTNIETKLKKQTKEQTKLTKSTISETNAKETNKHLAEQTSNSGTELKKQN